MSITIIDNGPIKIETTVDVLDSKGNKHISDNKLIFLCRCGLSKNKPFCDGRHTIEKFQSNVEFVKK